MLARIQVVRGGEVIADYFGTEAACLRSAGEYAAWRAGWSGDVLTVRVAP